jgi:hypothetical protein
MVTWATLLVVTRVDWNVIIMRLEAKSNESYV